MLVLRSFFFKGVECIGMEFARQINHEKDQKHDFISNLT